MRRAAAGAVVIAMALAVVLPACAGASHRDDGEACRLDAECTSGLCDGAVCAQPHAVYGAACTAAPRTSEGFRDARIETCGAYLCIDGRCRSCTSDSQCMTELGAPKCAADESHPGMRCGR